MGSKHWPAALCSKFYTYNILYYFRQNPPCLHLGLSQLQQTEQVLISRFWNQCVAEPYGTWKYFLHTVIEGKRIMPSSELVTCVLIVRSRYLIAALNVCHRNKANRMIRNKPSMKIFIFIMKIFLNIYLCFK